MPYYSSKIGIKWLLGACESMIEVLREGDREGLTLVGPRAREEDVALVLLEELSGPIQHRNRMK